METRQTGLNHLRGIKEQIYNGAEHHNTEASWGKRLIITMIMNLIIPAVQIYGGIVSGAWP